MDEKIVKDLIAGPYAGHVHLVERSGKQGLGTAYIAGFKWAIEHKANYIFEMDADFSHLETYILELTRHLLEEGMPYGVCYNVNAPVGELQGVRWTRQCRGFWHKEMEERVNEQGEKYYWLAGEFVNMEPEAEDTDIWAMNNHYVSVHPCTIDQTAYAEI